MTLQGDEVLQREKDLPSVFAPFFCQSQYQYRASLVAQTVKRLPTMRGTWVQSLGQKDPLEKEMAPHSSTLAWKIPWTEEPDRLQPMESQRVGHNKVTSLSLFTFFPYRPHSDLSTRKQFRF